MDSADSVSLIETEFNGEVDTDNDGAADDDVEADEEIDADAEADDVSDTESEKKGDDEKFPVVVLLGEGKNDLVEVKAGL